MLKKFVFVALAGAAALSACGPSEADIAAAIAQTETARPTHTPLPLPTDTPPPPTPTLIAVPEVLDQTFSGVSVIYRDEFPYVMQNLAPQGWESEAEFAMWVTSDNRFKIQPADTGDWSGTVFWFSKERINPNEGVYFDFQYTGTRESFTLGLDDVQANGQRTGRENFYSVAMQLDQNLAVTHTKRGQFQTGSYFDGNLKLQENTWYTIALAFDGDGNYLIKIWKPDEPDKQLVFRQTLEQYPKSYYFISWISAKRSLLIDDFTVFTFDDLIQE
jgi:hypothetical protein